MLTVDSCGMSCPQPVLLAKNAANNSNEVEVICDNNTSRNNVAKYLKSNGFDVKIEEDGENFRVKGNK